MRRTIPGSLIVLFGITPVLLFILLFGARLLIGIRSGHVDRVSEPPIKITRELTPSDINSKYIDYDSRTILHSAVLKGDVALVGEMLRVGGDPNILDLHGLTPLHLAARNGQSDMVEMLLRHGANRWIMDEAGRTAKDYALQAGHTLTAQVIDRPQTAEASALAVPQAASAFATSSPHREEIHSYRGISLISILGLLSLPVLLILFVAMSHHNRQRRQRMCGSGEQASRLRDLTRIAERMEARVANLETILAHPSAGKEGGV